jgi:hypothetical protein
MDLSDLYRIFNKTATEKTFLPEAHGTFSKMEQIFGNKTSL